MKNEISRIMCINSLSLFGKNALTIMLPVLSAAGLEAVPLPSVMLTSQPGGLPGYSYRTLSGEMEEALTQWRALGLEFDALYSGFLCSKEQVEITAWAFETFGRPGSLKLVDPAMADNGKMYAFLDENFPVHMAKLCKMADIITPNITEACFLLGEDYSEGVTIREYFDHLLDRLAAAFPARIIVLTGVHADEDRIGSAVFDRADGCVNFVMGKKLPGHFHGTGDLFASAMTAGLLRGMPTLEAVEVGQEMVTRAIGQTTKLTRNPRHGLVFEPELGWLIDRLNRQ